MRLSPADAVALAAALDVDYATTPVCLACLTFVSFPLVEGDEREARRAAARLAPDLWDEGLDRQAWAALLDARARGVERAAEALRELQALGARSEVVRAIVLRLAAAQVEQIRGQDRRRGLA